MPIRQGEGECVEGPADEQDVVSLVRTMRRCGCKEMLDYGVEDVEREVIDDMDSGRKSGDRLPSFSDPCKDSLKHQNDMMSE